MLDHPFLAAAVARLPLELTEDGGRCATAATDGYHIVVNAGFLGAMSDEEALFVLAHELLHAVLGHPDRRGERSAPTWNQAADYAVNLVLVDGGMRMPGSGLYSPAYRGMAAETIYERLRTAGARGGPAAASALGDAGRRLAESLSPAQLDQLVAQGGWCIQADPGGGVLGPLPDGPGPTALERLRIRDSLAAAMAGRAHGRFGAMAEEEVRAATRRAVPWEELLSRFVTGLRRSDYRTFPFNKKHLHRGVFLPSVGVPGPQRLVVAIDTSGSISGDVAERLLGEADGLRAATECALTVLQCDTSVTWSRTFEAWEPSILDPTGRMRLAGRGGTSFAPVFEWISADVAAGELPPDAVIYLTDGFGTFPRLEPPWPVVWVVPARGLDDAGFPFGSVIRLAAGND